MSKNGYFKFLHDSNLIYQTDLEVPGELAVHSVVVEAALAAWPKYRLEFVAMKSSLMSPDREIRPLTVFFGDYKS